VNLIGDWVHLIKGFLSTGDSRLPGNWALHDQLTALRWIKENIDSFGGDPESVTLFGEDSGAASATMLAMSPLADGLFQRVIALSGNALCAQYMQVSVRVDERWRSLGGLCHDNNNNNVLHLI
jgi:carboxylesterase type B